MAEIKRIMGCLNSPVDLRDYKTAPSKTVNLPSDFRLVREAQVLDQGFVGSCVAHSLASMLETEFFDRFSTGFVYGYRPSGYSQEVGMYPREALKTLNKIGNVKFDRFEENVEMKRAKVLVDERFEDLRDVAAERKITGYARLYTENDIKSFLYNTRTPIPISISTENMKLVEGSSVLDLPKVYPKSNHMILIVGWNELGFIVQNSWGKSWGDRGFAILPYEYKINEAWGVTLEGTPKKQEIFRPFLYALREILMKIIELFKKKR